MQFLATESRETSLEDVVLFSKVYPGWLATSSHFLGGVDGALQFFSVNSVRAFLLILGHGTYDLLSSVKRLRLFSLTLFDTSCIPHFVLCFLSMSPFKQVHFTIADSDIR